MLTSARHRVLLLTRAWLLLLPAGLAVCGTRAQPPLDLPDCEPPCLRQAYRVENTGQFFYYQWMKVSAPGVDLGGKVGNRFLDAAAVRIYRTRGAGLSLTDIGTVGIFRGTQNGWFATGHGGKLQRFLGGDTPLAPQEGAICLREDWLDLKRGDFVVIDRLAQTLDGRIFEGLAPTGARALPWRSDKQATMELNLVFHDPRLVSPAGGEWTSPGLGCLRVANTSKKSPGRVYQPGTGYIPPGQISFRARNLHDGEVRLAVTAGTRQIGQVSVTGAWKKFSLAVPETRGPAEEGIGLVLPPGAGVCLDDFQWQEAEPAVTAKIPESLKCPYPAPAAVSMESLLRGARGTTLHLGPEGPAFVSSTPRSLPEHLRLLARQGSRTCVLELGVLHGRQDWWNLVEYLAASFDPDSDSPILKPYAYRRLAHGRDKPWTDAFERIEIRLSHRDPAGGEVAKRVGRDLARHVGQEVLPACPYWPDAREKLIVTIPEPPQTRKE